VAGPPSVVLVDDGELDRVRVILERLGVDFALCRRARSDAETPAPRDLLITTGRRALARRGTEAKNVPGGPLWLCVHGQDFGDLRAELRSLGVHYLVHSAVDQDSLRLLIAMLLHDRAERRSGTRLPVGCEVTLRAGRNHQYARLLELSHDGARLRSEVALESGDWVQIDLPRELAGPHLDSLSGHVARAQRSTQASGEPAWLVAVELDPLAAEAEAELAAILQGTHPGTRISPLAAPPEELHPEERRRSPRRAYRKRVAALTGTDRDTPRVALGHDLSADGIRIAAQPGLAKGMRVALGLYGAEGGTPVVVEAEVVADYGARGLGLEFRDTTEEKRRALERLVADLPPLESLDAEGTRRGLVISELLASQKS
jgi:hypothetical protein